MIYIDASAKDWSAIDGAGRFTKARAKEIVEGFGDDADGLLVVDSTAPLPGPMVSQAAE